MKNPNDVRVYPPPPRKTPTVDVVIPAYNAQRFIGETLHSVLAQTLLPHKIIVVNDGSTDQTVDIVEGFQSERIELISVEHGGVSHARNMGIRAAQADYIAFLDADDLWHVDKLKAQMEALTSPPSPRLNAKAAYSYALVCDEQGIVSAQSEYTNSPFPPGQFVEELLQFKNLSGSSSSVIVEAHFLKSNNLFFDEELSFGEDFDLWTQIARHTDFLLVPWEHVFIRQNPASTTRSQSIEEKYQELSDNFYYLNKHVDYGIPKNTQGSTIHRVNDFLFYKLEIKTNMQFLEELKRRAPDYFNLIFKDSSTNTFFMLLLFLVLKQIYMRIWRRLSPFKRLQLFFSEGTIYFSKSKQYKQEQEKREFETRNECVSRRIQQKNGEE